MGGHTAESKMAETLAFFSPLLETTAIQSPVEWFIVSHDIVLSRGCKETGSHLMLVISGESSE